MERRRAVCVLSYTHGGVGREGGGAVFFHQRRSMIWTILHNPDPCQSILHKTVLSHPPPTPKLFRISLA